MAFIFTLTAISYETYEINAKSLPNHSNLSVVSARFGRTLGFEWSRRVINQNWEKSHFDHPELGASSIFEGGHLPDKVSFGEWQGSTKESRDEYLSR